MEPILEEHIKKSVQQYGLNNHASVGVIEITGKESWYWLEVKTKGYPPKNFEGTYCIMGGNWIHKWETHPIHVLLRQFNEEICKSPRTSEGEPVNKLILKELCENIKAVADYFIHVPEEAHGNPNQKYDYDFVCSLFETEISRHYLGNSLGLNEGFSAKELEEALTGVQKFQPAVLTLQDLEYGVGRQFCWGYDQLMTEYIERRHGFRPKIRMFEEIVVEKLKTSPDVPFADRDTPQHCRINPYREPTDNHKLFNVPPKKH
jgi:hypothetical protein